ncbi:protein FAM161B [Fundulus diaphanus]
MSKCDTLVEEGLRSELMLKAHLKALRMALQQQLQETRRRQTEELDERIHQNTLLSADTNYKFAERRSAPASALISYKKASHYPTQRPNVFSHSLVPSLNSKHCSVSTQQCERCAPSKTTQQKKEEEAEAECKKKFSAVPVPSCVTQPVYQEMMELREKERKRGHEQRKVSLLSSQKPFSFEQRDKKTREKMSAKLNQGSEDPKNCFRVQKTSHRHLKGSEEQKDQQELCRNLQTQIASKQHAPSQAGCLKLRIADHTKEKKLGFLDEQPSFKPKIIPQVPDFKRLHRALQREALEKKQSQDVTRCQPFVLKTSALPARKSMKSPETPQRNITSTDNKSKNMVPATYCMLTEAIDCILRFQPADHRYWLFPLTSKVFCLLLQVSRINLSRSKSLGALTLISRDTLPTYITDAARQRCAAIRKSIEMRESKNQESAEWLKSHQMRSQAMKRTVALHAKLLDPHSSLKDVCKENLQRHREADLQKVRDYMRELRDMKARVTERPYLFEQVKQKNAKAQAEQTYRRKLQKVGIKEQFVEETGESFRYDYADTSTSSHGSEKEIQSREENVDDGEKIEDVEEKSVKSKAEEMP